LEIRQKNRRFFIFFSRWYVVETRHSYIKSSKNRISNRQKRYTD